MIKVNLIGAGRKKPVKTATAVSLPATLTPIALILIAVACAGAGYWWYLGLSSQAADLDEQIRGLEARKAQVEAVIKQDEIYEARKKMLESRVKIIEDLQKNQVSPVLALDQLAEAVERTQYVWLSNIDQREGLVTMSGTGTSLTAIADFYTNLNATGFFRNIDLGPSQESAGNFSFSLRCEFAPPRSAASNAPAATNTAGGN